MLTTVEFHAKEDPGSLVASCQRLLEGILRSHQSRPIPRCWSDSPYTEEELMLLEEEVLPAMAAFLARVSEIEEQLKAAERQAEALEAIAPTGLLVAR